MMNESKKMELINYYSELYFKYIPYISDRMWGSYEDGYGNPIDGVNAEKFKKVGHIFSMYMSRLDMNGLPITDKLLAVFLFTELCNVVGNSCGYVIEKDRLESVTNICSLMLKDIEGIAKVSGLKHPDLIKSDDVRERVRVIPPDGYDLKTTELWDGVIEYTMELKDGYVLQRDVSNITHNTDGAVEIITLADGDFDNRGILSYKVNGDKRGEIVVKYWSLMFKGVLEYFKENRREEFLDIVERGILKGKKKVFVDFNGDSMDAPKYIGDGVYIEGHTGPNQIKNLLSILFVDLGLSLEDLEVCVLEGNLAKGKRRNF